MKQNFEIYLFLDFFIWCIENELVKENAIFDQFLIGYKSYNFKVRTMFPFYCAQNLLLYLYYGIHLAILRLLSFCTFFIFENPHLFSKVNRNVNNVDFQKSEFHNIPESLNSAHNICRIRISKRNKTNSIVLTSKLWVLKAIPFGKKDVFSRGKLSEEI